MINTAKLPTFQIIRHKDKIQYSHTKKLNYTVLSVWKSHMGFNLEHTSFGIIVVQGHMNI